MESPKDCYDNTRGLVLGAAVYISRAALARISANVSGVSDMLSGFRFQ